MTGENDLKPEEIVWMEDLLVECRRQGVVPRHRFELASYAIVSKGNTKKAIARLKKMRQIEAQYAFHELDSATALLISEDASPGSSHASGRDCLGRPSLYMDYAAFIPTGFDSEHKLRCLMKATYDSLAALTATIRDVREGCVMIASAKGMGWKNFSMDLEQRMSDLYQDAYPIKMKGIYILDSSLLISAVVQLSRVFLKKKIADRIKICSAADFLSGKVGNFTADQLPQEVGGAFFESDDEWFERSLKQRQASIAELGPV